MNDAASERDRLEVLASEFMDRLRRGESPSASEYAEEDPDLAADILDLFPTIVAAEGLKTRRTAPLPDQTTVLVLPDPPAGAPSPLQSSSSPLASSGRVRTGTQLGKYTLGEKLGQGSLGTVWRSEHPDLGIPVAVKVLHANVLEHSEEHIQRFLREARTAALINHPSVVRIYDAGVDQGLHFLVMEFIEGGTVGQLLHDAGGKLPVERALEITMAVASALEAAAEYGVVHRDIKPDNIVLDGKGAPKLADLGLAKQITGSEMDSVTATGIGLGTPLYIAPEQAMGGTPVDTRADIYSLGAMLYHMVTAHPPFSGGTMFRIIDGHLHEPVMDPRERNPGLPEALSQLICRMLEKSPADRYQTASELKADLRRLQNGLSVSPRSPTSPLPPWRTIVVSSLIILLIVGTFVSTLIWSGKNGQRNTGLSSSPGPGGRDGGAFGARHEREDELEVVSAEDSAIHPRDWDVLVGELRPGVYPEPLANEEYDYHDGILNVLVNLQGVRPVNLVYAPVLIRNPFVLTLEAKGVMECGLLPAREERAECRIRLHAPGAEPPPTPKWETIVITGGEEGITCTVDGRPAHDIEGKRTTSGRFVIYLAAGATCSLRTFSLATRRDSHPRFDDFPPRTPGNGPRRRLQPGGPPPRR
ncbi:MAG: serine/threonine protein kinase [Lentisphaerae bacterium]|nr:serine/threonine protein kinase [Lentisphaerota bacterium]